MFTDKDSPNCQLECKFALNCKKKLVPVLAEPSYAHFRSDGWLGAVLGSLLFYDASRGEEAIRHMIRNELKPGSLVGKPGNHVQVPNGEKELRAWLAKTQVAEDVINRLVEEEFTSLKDIEFLGTQSVAELKILFGCPPKQALLLSNALQELLGWVH